MKALQIQLLLFLTVAQLVTAKMKSLRVFRDHSETNTTTMNTTIFKTKAVEEVSRARRDLTEEDQAIMGGKMVYGSKYPYFALLFGAGGYRNDFTFFCGGVLIAPEYVLTAASCVQHRNRMSFVRLGGDNFADGEEIDVDEIIINPRYRNNGGILEYDFAVLKLKEAAETTPAKLNTDTIFPNVGGTILETLGYGDNDVDTGEPPKGSGSEADRRSYDDDDDDDDAYDDLILKEFSLEKVDLSYVAFGSCQADYVEGISENLHLCVEPIVGFNGPCTGDQGGPLLFGDLVVGIFSFGSSCLGAPVNIFTKISSNYYWIATQAGLPIPTPSPTPSPTKPPRPTYSSYDSYDDHKPTKPKNPFPSDVNTWCAPLTGYFGKPLSWAQSFFGGANPENPDVNV